MRSIVAAAMGLSVFFVSCATSQEEDREPDVGLAYRDKMHLRVWMTPRKADRRNEARQCLGRARCPSRCRDDARYVPYSLRNTSIQRAGRLALKRCVKRTANLGV